MLKLKYGLGICHSDIIYTAQTVGKLVVYAFVGGLVSGALGLGGGAIYNPLLLSMGVPPAVSSATGMYMIMFSTMGSSIIYILYQVLEFEYALWIGLWCVLGSIAGLFLLDKLN